MQRLVHSRHSGGKERAGIPSLHSSGLPWGLVCSCHCPSSQFPSSRQRILTGAQGTSPMRWRRTAGEQGSWPGPGGASVFVTSQCVQMAQDAVTRIGHAVAPQSRPRPGSCPTAGPTDSEVRVGASFLPLCWSSPLCPRKCSSSCDFTSSHPSAPAIYPRTSSVTCCSLTALSPSPNRQLCPLPLAPGHLLLSICQFTHPLVTPNMTWALPLTPPNSWLTSPCP